MADLAAIRTALANTIQNNISGLTASGQMVGQVNPPYAVVLPGGPGQVVTYETIDGEANFSLRVLILASYADDAAGQSLMDSYISTSGPASISAVLRANPTLGGACEFCVPENVHGYQLADWAGSQYLTATLVVSIGA